MAQVALKFFFRAGVIMIKVEENRKTKSKNPKCGSVWYHQMDSFTSLSVRFVDSTFAEIYFSEISMEVALTKIIDSKIELSIWWWHACTTLRFFAFLNLDFKKIVSINAILLQLVPILFLRPVKNELYASDKKKALTRYTTAKT